MSTSAYLSYLILVLTMVYSPGPMTLFLMANGMQMSFKQIWPILIGSNNAYLLSIIVFSIGLAGLLQQNIWILKSIQLGGIIYLLYLAYVQWNKKTLAKALSSDEMLNNSRSLYTKGALIALSNPKTILLFSLVFPQFTSSSENEWVQIVILGITFLVLQFSSGCFYAFFGKRVRILLEKPEHQSLMNRVSAAVLALVAGFLILKL